MRSFFFATGVGIVNEESVEERIELSIDSMVNQSVLHGCLMNMSRFGIVDAKKFVRTVPVRFCFQILIKRVHGVRKMQRKFLDVTPSPFPAQELAPCGEQICNGDDRLIWMSKPQSSLSLSLENATIVQRIKEGYLLWMEIAPHIAKSARYTIGTRIENIFIDLLEQTYVAYFSSQEQKSEKIAGCTRTADTLKFLLSVAWEGKLISNGQYERVALKLVESGKMLGGWQKSLQNPTKKNRDL